MSVWMENLHTTLIFGSIAFALLLIPGVIWQYRRQGRWSTARMIGWAAVCVYFTGLFVYTWLPIPENPVAFCAAHNVRSNLIPFQFVDDIRREAAGLNLVSTLRSTVFLQAAFNIMLFLPFGVILHRYLNRSIFVTTLLGALTSAFIEFSQYTGLFGAVPCAYRTGDIDDFLLNTVGALLGAVIAPLVLWWMPSAKTLAASRLFPRSVTSRRRWLGMVFDAFLFVIAAAFSAVVFAVAASLLPKEAATSLIRWSGTVGDMIALVLVFVLPALRGNGASAGQSAVWLTPKWESRDGQYLIEGSVAQKLQRSLPVAGTWVLADVFVQATGSGVLFISLAAVIVVVTEFALVPFSHTHRGLSGIVSGAYFLDSREAVAGGPEGDLRQRLTPADRARLGMPEGPPDPHIPTR